MEQILEHRRWLIWLVNVRIIVLTFLLGIQLAIVRLTPTTLPLRPFIAAILLWYTLSVFFLLLASVWKDEHVQAKLQVFTDLGMATLLIYVTGGVDSAYNFLYPLVIVVACIVLPRAWAILRPRWALSLTVRCWSFATLKFCLLIRPATRARVLCWPSF